MHFLVGIKYCVPGIRCPRNSIIGHRAGDELAKEAMRTGKGILQLVREKKLLTEEQIQEIFQDESLTGHKKMKYDKG